MLIDWFTVLAQIVNFAILVLLLRHFLWKRLVKAVDDREKRIDNRLNEASQMRSEAERQMTEAAARKQELDQSAADMLAQARKEAEDRRKSMIQEARDEVRRLEAQWNEELERDRAMFLAELRRRAATELLVVTQRALSDLACADVQHSAIQVFLEKLTTLDRADWQGLSGDSVAVLSAIDLPEETREQIRKVLQDHLSAAAQIEFIRSPALAWGIELRANGRRIGWSATSYMETLEDNVRQALEHRAEAVVG